MFDSLQEGIVVIDGNKIKFLNELSNKIFNHMTGLKSFAYNRCKDGTYSGVDALDRRIFFLFENNKNQDIQTDSKKQKRKGGKSKKGTASSAASTKSDPVY